MAKSITDQREIEREIVKKSGVRGFPDKMLILSINSRGMSLREKGKKSGSVRSMTWPQWIEWIYTHG